ncbi:MAG: squalene--hopene cyclase [Planctomycetota bacterium]
MRSFLERLLSSRADRFLGSRAAECEWLGGFFETRTGGPVAVPGPSGGEAPDPADVDRAIDGASQWLLDRQHDEGYWVAEFEADSTLESYFILLRTFLGRRDDPKIPKYARRLLSTALPEGGWTNYRHGPPDLSVSVLTYFALKVAGIPADHPAMRRARAFILERGGAAKANTYTKYHLAFFGQYDWAHVPAVPPEMIFLPHRAPVSIYSLSSWSRTIFVPLSIIYALKPVRPLPPECHVDELFVGGRENADLGLGRGAGAISWDTFFLLTDKALKVAEKFPIQAARRLAIDKAKRWVLERFRRSGGPGAILPAMVNTVIALKCLGYPDDDPLLRTAFEDLDGLEIHRPEDDSIQVQPCHSPVWDTAISSYALSLNETLRGHPALRKAARWLLSKEVRTAGDWKLKNRAPPSGWYFEFENEFYPDVDDSIMVMMALRSMSPRGEDLEVDAAIERGLTWVLGMQSADGGWASFDRDNDKELLTKIPFADFNALIDPSTVDITSRVLEMLAIVAPERFSLSHRVVRRALRFIEEEQCEDGSWYGRWGVNYLYGTWQALRGLRLIGEDMSKPYVRRAVDWLLRVQLPDGGWGERADTYEDPSRKGKGPSTASQTAWALMGLLAAGEGGGPAVRRGVRFLLEGQTAEGSWEEDEWTGTGFPRVFYMKYHYYRHYWPLMALIQYRRFLRGYRP